MNYDDWKLATPDGDDYGDATCTTCYLRPCQCGDIALTLKQRRQQAEDDAADAAIDDMKIEERS